jgi:octaprenyl-diphosphate synthase
MPDPSLNIAPDPGHRDPVSLLESAVTLVKQDLDEVNRVIRTRLESDIALINTLAAYIINSGGKRLRPLILLLCARCCGYQGKDHVLLAAVIEFIHTATLLHDDVVDASATRRGQTTANEVWGNEASVLVGDFLYSRSFEMMVETENVEVMRILAATTNAIAEGEVLQLLNTHTPETTEEQYMETIHRKTAKLFESAAWLGGVVANEDERCCQALSLYGLHLGTAFQLVDDILDYSAESEDIGKDVGDDLAEGKPTLPLIYSLEHGNRKQKAVVSAAIVKGDRDKISEVLEIVHTTGALKYTHTRAREQAQLAVEALAPVADNEFRKSLADLAEFSVLRGY